MRERFRNRVGLITGNENIEEGDFQVALESMVGGTGRLDPESSTEYTTGTPFLPGDVLFGKLRPYLAKVWLADRVGFAVGDIHVYRPRLGVVPEFLKYVVLDPEFIRRVDSGTYGSKMPRADWEDIREIGVAFPSPAQQRAIADFLDRETAQIDAMIEAQVAVLSLLRERRKALLTSSFPASLSRKPLRQAITFLTSGSRGWGDFASEEGDVFIRIGNLPRDDLRLRGDVQRVDLPADLNEGRRTQVREGDLLFSITAYLGSVAVVAGDQWIGGYVNQHVALCRLAPEPWNPKYLGYFMLSPEGQRLLQVAGDGGTKVGLALGDIRRLKVPCPTMAEQHRIVRRLEDEFRRQDEIVAAASAVVGLLHERREALVAAAVTGGIDPTTGIERVEEAS